MDEEIINLENENDIIEDCRDTDYAIALHQQRIRELKEIREHVDASNTENIRFRIETKHWYGYSINSHERKIKDKIQLSKSTANLILDTAIELEKKEINKLIDILIEKRTEQKKDAKYAK